MKNYNMILTEKQKKKSALSSGKIDKYKYLTGEENKQKKFRIKAKSKRYWMKIIERNSLNLMNLLRRILMSTESVYHMRNKKKSNKLIWERSFNFHNLENFRKI